MVSSAGSEDSEPDGVDFRGDSCLPDVRVFLSLRSALPEEVDEAEEWCEVVGFVRARTDRRVVSAIVYSKSIRDQGFDKEVELALPQNRDA